MSQQPSPLCHPNTRTAAVLIINFKVGGSKAVSIETSAPPMRVYRPFMAAEDDLSRGFLRLVVATARAINRSH